MNSKETWILLSTPPHGRDPSCHGGVRFYSYPCTGFCARFKIYDPTTTHQFRISSQRDRTAGLQRPATTVLTPVGYGIDLSSVSRYIYLVRSSPIGLAVPSVYGLYPHLAIVSDLPLENSTALVSHLLSVRGAWFHRVD